MTSQRDTIGTPPRPIQTVSDLAADASAVASDSPDYNATLVGRQDLTHELTHVWVRPDGPPVSFAPGQYMTLGLRIGERLVQRPYSIASTADDVPRTGYEFYLRRNPDGAFTPSLWRLPIGHRVRVTGPRGRLVLEVDDERTHLFVSSGTAHAPFVAMIRDWELAARPRPAILINGVSYVRDLGFRSELERWATRAQRPRAVYLPTVSRARAPENGGWHGRCGRAESLLDVLCDELGLGPANTVAFLCGNPAMVEASERVLAARGFNPEGIRTELYWPQPRTG